MIRRYVVKCELMLLRGKSSVIVVSNFTMKKENGKGKTKKQNMTQLQVDI